MIPVRPHIANSETCVGSQFPFDLEGPGSDGGRLQIRLNSPGRNLGAWRYLTVRRERELRDREVRDTVSRVEWRVLIEAVPQRVLKIVVHSEAGADHGFVAPRAPRETNSWLWQKFRAVDGEH